jgi:hypothetical protein
MACSGPADAVCAFPKFERRHPDLAHSHATMCRRALLVIVLHSAFIEASPVAAQIPSPVPVRAGTVLVRQDTVFGPIVSATTVNPVFHPQETAQTITINEVRASLPRGGALPVGFSEEAAKAWWGQTGTKVLSTGLITAQDQVLGASVEVLTDIVGPFRVALGGNITAKNPDDGADDAEVEGEAALSRLLQNGGLLHGTATYPLFFRGARPERRAVSWMMRTSVAGDAPRINGISDVKNVAGMLGTDLNAHAIGVNGIIGLEAGVYGQAFWYNNRYERVLGVGRNTVMVGGVRAGFIINERTRLGVYYPALRSSTLAGKVRTVVYFQQTGG